MTITGTWEEIVALGDKLRGKELTLIVRDTASQANDQILPKKPLSESEWNRLREQLQQGMSEAWPTGLSVVDAMREDRR